MKPVLGKLLFYTKDNKRMENTVQSPDDFGESRNEFCIDISGASSNELCH